MDLDPTDMSDRSESSHSEMQLRAFQDYEKVKELNLTVDKNKKEGLKQKDFIPKDFIAEGRPHPLRFDEFITDASELAMALNKPKDFNFLSDSVRYGLNRNSSNGEVSEMETLSRNKEPVNQKETMFNFGREIRQKNIHTSLERNNKDSGFSMDREMKGFGLLKNYNLERMKEFNLSLDRVRDSHVNSLSLERIRVNPLMENSGILESSDYRNLQIQQRSPDLDAMAYERMRRSHLLTTDLSNQSIATQLPRSHSVNQSQHQQQQVKSFTIDAILGLRNNQREKHQRGHHSYRKHQGQEGSTKSSSSSSCTNGGGKLKRVRTIFTAEQLERLEGEFARQQYMVGPERLYLAHALRLTEAQVKVWFQNRRIKWRKLNHEQQSQRLHEFHQTSLSNLEQEDSNEPSEWQK